MGVESKMKIYRYSDSYKVGRCLRAHCDGCKKLYKTKGLIQVKGKFLCYMCRRSTESAKLQTSACMLFSIKPKDGEKIINR